MPFLFSYGTLQDVPVQRSLFGRELIGVSDELVGFVRSVITLTDAEFVAGSGSADHAIVRFTGRPEDRVSGTVFEVSAGELAMADEYEPDGYERVNAVLGSGNRAWVYAESGA